MEQKLEWLNEEEGRITFFENKKVFLVAGFFVTGEEAAEFRLQDVVFPEKQTKNDIICEEITLKVTECVSECFRLLWEEGLDEVLLLEPAGTKIAKILNSTPVVKSLYSEYMMRQYFQPQKSTDCGRKQIELTKNEEGYLCENAEKTFFCRLLPYEAEQPGDRCFYLYEVEVNRKKRNQGIATSCLSQLFQMLAEEGPLTMYLQVGSYNEPAVHLYKKLGFGISEELCYYESAE